MDLHESSDSQRIEVLPMAVSARNQIHGMDEDWTGKTSTATRRKLQNRLNQRALSEYPSKYYSSGLKLIRVQESGET